MFRYVISLSSGQLISNVYKITEPSQVKVPSFYTIYKNINNKTFTWINRDMDS